MANDHETSKDNIEPKENTRATQPKTSKKSGVKKTLVSTLLNLGILLCIAVFLYSAYQLISIYRGYKAGEQEYSEISEQYTSKGDTTAWKRTDTETGVDGTENATENTTGQEPEAGEEVTEEATEYVPLEVNFQALQEINPDIVGWLDMEALDISYPIVQGDDNAEYLHRTFEKKSNYAGSIFMDFTNSGDFSDCHTIIYGHNMKNQSMFGKLKFIKEKQKYQDSRYFWIYTPEGKYRYEIFSARVTDASGDVYTLFYTPGQSFVDYMKKMASESQIPQITRDYKETDKVVTLTTCTSDDTKRFVVQGVRVESWYREGE